MFNKKLLITLLLLFSLFIGGEVLAASSLQEQAGNAMGTFGNESYGHEDAPYLPAVIGRIISVVLAVLAVVMVVLIILAGVKYMTAEGDKTKLEEAKKTITNAILGLVICVTAYSITSFVVRRLMESAYLID